MSLLRSLMPCLGLMLFLPLTSHAQTTAATNLDAATAVAAQNQARVDLLAVVGVTANPDGTAPNWLYLYQTDDSALAGVFATEGTVAGSAIDLTQIGLDANALVGLASPDPIGNQWRNSDDAVQRAETQGGADFRTANPDAVISMVLIDFPAENLIDLPGIEALGPYWLITYTSAASLQTQIYIVESITGILFPLDALGGDAGPTLEEAVATFASDAELVAVASVLPDLTTEGTSLFWQRSYYSPSQGTSRDFFVSLTGMVLGEMDRDAPPSTTPLPESRLAASEALTIALDDLALPDDLLIGPLVQGRLRYGLDARMTDRLAWQFAVLSMDATGTLDTQQVLVDATTGTIVRVSTDAVHDLPHTLSLAPNYPNPFRTTTTLQYTVTEPMPITLTVFDVLGRTVRTLTDGLHTPGTHRITWDGTDAQGQRLPSGLYLYRLMDAQGATQTRSLLLVD